MSDESEEIFDLLAAAEAALKGKGDGRFAEQRSLRRVTRLSRKQKNSRDRNRGCFHGCINAYPRGLRVV